MPYIKPADRRAILKGRQPGNVGELTYALTVLCTDYLATVGAVTGGTDVRYQDYAEVVAALECAKLEFYRRAVAPYEDVKIRVNGDVY